MEYCAPSGTGAAEVTEKRSRFIGFAAPVSDEQSAAEIIARIKSEHRGARHNAWCWTLPDGSERCSDDGEPQGSAGAPMLEILRHGNIRGIVVVVTRYFGGVLLGTGGLARAYSAAAKGAVQASNIVRFVTKRRFSVRTTYALQAKVKAEITSGGGEILSAQYGADIEIVALTGQGELDPMSARLRDATSGSAQIVDLGDIPVPAQGGV